MVYQDLALVEPQDISTNLNMGHEQLRRGPLGWLGFVDRKAMRQQLRGRAGPARRTHRADDPAGRDALRRPAPGRGPGPQRDPGQRRVAGHPAARRADRRARLRADQERRGADPPDGRRGHRDRARHPRPPALLRGRRPDRHPQPRQEGRRRARRGHRPRPRGRLDHRLQGVDVRSSRRSDRADPRRRRVPVPPPRRHHLAPGGDGRPGEGPRGSASSWSRRSTRRPSYRPATSRSTGRTARCRCGCTATTQASVGPRCCGCTAARSCSATSTCPRPTGPRARSAPGPVRSSSASTTGSRSAACTTRCRSTTASRPPAGCATPPAELGVDPARITVGGASAGGNLATAAVLRLRDEDGWLPAALVPVYPVLHPALPEPSPEVAALLDEVPPALRFTPQGTAGINANYLGGQRRRRLLLPRARRPDRARAHRPGHRGVRRPAHHRRGVRRPAPRRPASTCATCRPTACCTASSTSRRRSSPSTPSST